LPETALHDMLWGMKQLFRLCTLLIVFGGTGIAPARTVDITILHTTDLHGHVWPTTSYEGQTNVGGFLRCAARIAQIQKEIPSTILIDCGDTFQGAAESYLAKGRLMIDGLNFMQYDAWVLGNHEFDWGPDALRSLHDMVEVPFLAANIHFNSAGENWLPKIKPYHVLDKEGIRIAVIGLVTPGIPRWSRPYLLNGAQFIDSAEALAEIMPAVKAERPDIIVVAMHQGHKVRGDDFANQIQKVARTFPEIDIMLGGHSHTPVEDMRIGNVLFSQAGYHGIWLGRVDLRFDTVEKKVIAKRGMLEVMNDTIPYHEGLLAKWKNELDVSGDKLANVFGETKVELSTVPDKYGQSTMQQLICRAIAEETKAEFVLHGSLGDESIPPGTLFYRDAWRMVPYENTIGVVNLTPQEIKDILVENYSRPVTAHSFGTYNLRFSLNHADGVIEIDNLRDGQGEMLHPRKRYRVALNSYVLASGGERYLKTRKLAELPESRLTMIDKDTRAMVVDYIRENSPLNDELLNEVIHAD
jgi:5'-nucleotidase / UDP-sugar diphosphatase